MRARHGAKLMAKRCLANARLLVVVLFICCIQPCAAVNDIVQLDKVQNEVTDDRDDFVTHFAWLAVMFFFALWWDWISISDNNLPKRVRKQKRNNLDKRTKFPKTNKQFNWQTYCRTNRIHVAFAGRKVKRQSNQSSSNKGILSGQEASKSLPGMQAQRLVSSNQPKHTTSTGSTVDCSMDTCTTRIITGVFFANPSSAAGGWSSSSSSYTSQKMTKQLLRQLEPASSCQPWFFPGPSTCSSSSTISVRT